MCKYLHLLLLFIATLTVFCEDLNIKEVSQIRIFEDLIKRNNERLLILETELKAENSEYVVSSELCCETHIRQKQEELAACQQQAKSAVAQLKESEYRITTLLFNLTNCGLQQLAKDNQTVVKECLTNELPAAGLEKQLLDSFMRKISDLSSQLKVKDQQIWELQNLSNNQLMRLQAAQGKLKAYDELFDEFHPSSCLPFGSTTGIYRIKLADMDSFYAPCDARFAGSGWLVIQRRMDGSVNFYRNWTEYQAGFGSLSGEFFIGLEKLHRLTKRQPHELYVLLEDFEGEMRYAHYDNFSVGSEQTSYELTSLGKYHGNAGNSMGINIRQKFSTQDMDNDAWLEGSCAKRYHSAWWYDQCAALCNPNGKYYKKRQLSVNDRGTGIIWNGWHGFEETLKFVQLMIRPISTVNSD